MTSQLTASRTPRVTSVGFLGKFVRASGDYLRALFNQTQLMAREICLAVALCLSLLAHPNHCSAEALTRRSEGPAEAQRAQPRYDVNEFDRLSIGGAPAGVSALARGSEVFRSPASGALGDSVRARLRNDALLPSGTAVKLEPVLLNTATSRVSLRSVPQLTATLSGRFAGITPKQEFVFFTINPTLQAAVQKLVDRAPHPHVAVVAMDPTSGRVLALADKSPNIPNLALHSGFPAASLFKLVTSAAALEQGKISPLSTVWFRGGTYTLNRYNYLPDRKRDRRSMSASEALGRSCNPAFARIALNFLDQRVIESYAEHFGFNTKLNFDVPLATSEAEIPAERYAFSRTAAGFGDVHLSPVHAASLMSAIANDGIMPRPFLIERILNRSGEALYQARPEAVQPVITATTSRRLRDMMEYTTTIGTSRREFMLKNKPVLGNIKVAAKTGTLTGTNPKGMTNWFIAAAPKENPEIAIAVIVVDPRGISTRASNIGRHVFEAYFKR